MPLPARQAPTMHVLFKWDEFRADGLLAYAANGFSSAVGPYTDGTD